MAEAPGRTPPVEIRSYRTVFELERRLYRIDRLRLPPGGIPMRGVLYGLALSVVAVLTSRLPLIDVLAAVVPWYLRDVALPIAVAALLALLRLEGRPFHLAVRALVRHRFGPKWWRSLRPAPSPAGVWRPDALLMFPDGSEGRWRAFAFEGPGAVLVAGAHDCRGRPGGPFGAVLRRPHVTLRERSTREAVAPRRVIALNPGARMRIRPREKPWIRAGRPAGPS
jgi:hypothetical protein